MEGFLARLIVIFLTLCVPYTARAAETECLVWGMRAYRAYMPYGYAVPLVCVRKNVKCVVWGVLAYRVYMPAGHARPYVCRGRKRQEMVCNGDLQWGTCSLHKISLGPRPVRTKDK